MRILIFSAFLLIIILMIRYFSSSNSKVGLRLLSIFGIIIGLSALGLNSIFDSTFGASTPVTLRIENLTEKELKIYSIAFWDNAWSGKGNYVTYGGKIKPNKKTEFDFENDGTTEFWLIGKNQDNGIEYLNVITESKGEFDVEILDNSKVDEQKADLALQLTFRTDKATQGTQYLIWTNVILTGILILTLIKIKTGANKELS